MNITTLGPVGGDGGQEITPYTVPSGYKIKEVHLLITDVVEGIQFTVTDGTGGKTMPVLGGNSHNRKRHFVFALGQEEYLTGLSGHYGRYIDSVRLHTNRRVSPLYGGHGGNKEFSFSVDENEEIVGLVGRADWFVDALGVVKQRKKSFRQPDLKALQQVDGIGPKIAAILVENDVVNLEALAQTAVPHLNQILTNAGKRFGLADATTWSQQAAKLTALS